jgi:hypothetical protein
LVGWFFGWAAATYAEEAATEPVTEAEQRLALEALRQQLRQRDATIRMLTENLAIARTESDLFQRRWVEMQSRMQALGVSSAADAASPCHGQLLETIRSLYLAEAEKQRVLDQLKQLVSVLATNGDARSELARAEVTIAASEQPRFAVPPVGEAPPSVERARVRDVNPALQVVVLNVGEQHGVRVGMPFWVLQGERVVAEVRVVEVRRRISGALIERAERDVRLAPGDEARVRKS